MTNIYVYTIPITPYVGTKVKKKIKFVIAVKTSTIATSLFLPKITKCFVNIPPKKLNASVMLIQPTRVSITELKSPKTSLTR